MGVLSSLELGWAVKPTWSRRDWVGGRLVEVPVVAGEDERGVIKGVLSSEKRRSCLSGLILR